MVFAGGFVDHLKAFAMLGHGTIGVNGTAPTAVPTKTSPEQ
jgi:hypothetical protein